MSVSPLRISHPQKEGILYASHHRIYRVLLDVNELIALLGYLSPFVIYNVSQIVTLSQSEFSQKNFIDAYRYYLNCLKQGQVEILKEHAPLFSSIFTTTHQALFGMPVGEKGLIIRPILPVLQLASYQFYYDGIYRRFHSMVKRPESLSWGLQFSFPQTFADPKTGEIKKVLHDETFFNTLLFKRLMKWMRTYTLPVVFSIEEQRVCAPFRLGKMCFNWIDTYVGLQERGLVVKKRL